MLSGELRKIAVKVASELSKLRKEPWEVEPRTPEVDERWERSITLRCGQDKEKQITLEQRPQEKVSPDKINVSAWYPRYQNSTYPDQYQLERAGLSKPGSINVSDQKSPAAIAKDISRRLIDPWIPIYDLGKKMIQEEQARDNAHEVEFQRLLKKYNGVRYTEGSDRFVANLGKVNVTVTLNSATSVSIEFGVSMATGTAEQILDKITEALPPKACKECGSGLDTRDLCVNKDCTYFECKQTWVASKKVAKDLTSDDRVLIDLGDRLGTSYRWPVEVQQHQEVVVLNFLMPKGWNEAGYTRREVQFNPTDEVRVMTVPEGD